VSKIISLYN